MRGRQCLVALLGGLLGAFLFVGVQGVALAAGDTPEGGVFSQNAIKLISVVIFIGILASFIGYMFFLQKRFLDNCREDHQLELFAKSPAGLPSGTVRAVLALMIVSLSLYFIVIGYLDLIDMNQDIPETLTAVLGTVLGFYFGSRSQPASGGDEGAVKGQLEGFKRERDEAQMGQTDDRLKAARKVVASGKLLSSFLPPEWAKKAESLTSTLESGINKVEQLQQVGDALGALQESGKALKESPVAGMFQRAADAFKGPLGAAVPQIALIAALVGLGGKLAGSAYQKWKSRVLHAPFAPALVRINPVDSNTGFMLIMKNPVLKRAFATELAAGDNPFLSGFANAVLSAPSLQGLWQEYQTDYGDRFDSQTEFLEAVEGLRRGAVDRELQRLTAGQVAEELGGYEGLVSKLDALYSDPQAEAELHALFTTIEKLQREGRSEELSQAIELLKEKSA